MIRTCAPEGNRFLVCRDNHSATTPVVEKGVRENDYEATLQKGGQGVFNEQISIASLIPIQSMGEACYYIKASIAC